MKPFRLLFLALLASLSLSTTAQTYNAGVGSGTGGLYNVFVGTSAGRITTGQSNSFVGFNAGYANTTGSFNSFLGISAGLSNTTGGANSFVGTYAGYSNTTGMSNSFLGTSAGRSNTTGNENSFVGYRAGYTNTTGYYNSFLGAWSGYANTAGSNNSFVGFSAGYANTTGTYNSFVGSFAGYSNTTGNANSFLGTQAGHSNTTGNENSFVGTNAGYTNSTGYYNSFLGAQSGYNNTAGYRNSFVGYKAGIGNKTGNENAFFGSEAGRGNTTGGANTYIGTNAGVGANGSCNTMLGKGAGYRTNSGGNNTFVGRDAGGGNTTGSGNTFVGYIASMPSTLTNLSNASAIGFRASVSTSNALVLGSINGVNGATADTKVGIRTTAPAYNLHVNGTAAKAGGGSWTVASDKKLKKDITDFKDGLSVLEKIKPVSFRYNGKAGLPTDEQYVGVIAQDMQQIAPYTVGQFTYQDSTGKTEQYLDYDPNALTYILVNATKELKAENESQQNQLSAQQSQLETLQAENQLLKQELALIKQMLLKQSPETPAVARLFQNEPNPYNKTTIIKYVVPHTATSAQLKVFSVTGQLVLSQELTMKGQGQVELSTQTLPAGTYIYHLIVDGQSVGNKKMVLTP
jgi:hypothetical protein